jgi:hypothetical protein
MDMPRVRLDPRRLGTAIALLALLIVEAAPRLRF